MALDSARTGPVEEVLAKFSKPYYCCLVPPCPGIFCILLAGENPPYSYWGTAPMVLCGPLDKEMALESVLTCPATC